VDKVSARPKYLDVTEKIGLMLPIFWCLVALVIGILSQDIAGAIFVSTMTLLMTFLCFKSGCFIFSFQQHAGVLKNSTFDTLLKSVWFAALFGFTYSIFNSVFFQPSEHSFFYMVFSIAYFGFSLAVSKKWGSYYVETRI
jgi:hypothetical protein